MAYGSLLGRMIKLGLIWCFVWCAAGALAGFLLTMGPRDPRAIPHSFAPFLVGIPSAIVGGVAGMVFVFLAPALESRRRASFLNLAILGAIVGTGLGILFMRVVAHSLLTVVVSAVIGAGLGYTSPWLERL
jgi:hypothetical protein